MRYITEQELRDSFAGGVPPRFVLPADCRLTRWPSNTSGT